MQRILLDFVGHLWVHEPERHKILRCGLSQDSSLKWAVWIWILFLSHSLARDICKWCLPSWQESPWAKAYNCPGRPGTQRTDSLRSLFSFLRRLLCFVFPLGSVWFWRKPTTKLGINQLFQIFPTDQKLLFQLCSLPQSIRHLALTFW